MIFTDENGDKWETAPDNDTILIKVNPVKAEPKWHIELEEHNVGHDLVLELTDTSKDQAQLIKVAIEAVMQSIFEDTDYIEQVKAARHSIKGDK